MKTFEQKKIKEKMKEKIKSIVISTIVVLICLVSAPFAVHASTSISVNNSSLYWSRDDVYINGSSYALMLTTGSYLKTKFTGTSIAVNLDMSPRVSASVDDADYPLVRYEVDGGSWTNLQLSHTTTNISVSGLSSGTHSFRFEYVYGQTMGTGLDKWNTPVNAIKVTGLTLDNGATVVAPDILPTLLRVDGDSITEGFKAASNNDGVLGGSATSSYPYVLAGLLNTELTQIGYGGQGWTGGGIGNVPEYPNAVDFYYNGVSRLSGGVLPEPPDYWLINQGENDGSNNVASAAETRLEDARDEAGSNTQILLQVPFSGAKRSQLTAAFNSYHNSHPGDTKVHLIDLGNISYSTADGVHPDAAGHQVLAAALRDAINNVIASISASPSSIIKDTTGNSVTLTGTATSWTTGTPGTPTFSLSGGTGASITHQTISSPTSATLTISAGSAVGSLTITDPSTAATTHVTVVSSSTEGIIDSTDRYAWAENVGWIDLGTGLGNVLVTDSDMSGYAYGENVGWISLNCSNTSSCGTVDYKVSNDGSGHLSGYAYGENVGWINFDPSSGGVTIDSDGVFHGSAYGENIGWIIFNCLDTSSCGTVDYKVSTFWRPSVAPDPATQLSFDVQPSNTAIHQSISPPITVQVLDADGDLVSDATSTVTISIANNPSSGTLSGTVSRAAVSGVATFNNLSINNAGTGYTLTASASGLTSTTSSSFNITSTVPPAAVPTSVSFDVQPSDTEVDQIITPAIKVRVLDTNEDLVSDATSSVTLSIDSNPGGAILSGTMTRSAVNGVATFNNLRLDKAGSSYTLRASSSGLSDDTSSSFDISDVPMGGSGGGSGGGGGGGGGGGHSPDKTPVSMPTATNPSTSPTGSGEGCQPGYVFSETTGLRCPPQNTNPAGCLPSYKFSPLNGQKCLSNVSTAPSAGLPVLQPSNPVSTVFNFTGDLTGGDVGDDVKALQIFLNTHGFPIAASGDGSPGHETTYFGSLTKAALAKFQAANGIQPSSGYFGPLTRAFIKSHY